MFNLLKKFKKLKFGVLAICRRSSCNLDSSRLKCLISFVKPVFYKVNFSARCSRLHSAVKVAIRFNGAETNCKITYNLGILLMNSNYFAIFFSGIIAMSAQISIRFPLVKKRQDVK